MMFMGTILIGPICPFCANAHTVQTTISLLYKIMLETSGLHVLCSVKTV